MEDWFQFWAEVPYVGKQWVGWIYGQRWALEATALALKSCSVPFTIMTKDGQALPSALPGGLQIPGLSGGLGGLGIPGLSLPGYGATDSVGFNPQPEPPEAHDQHGQRMRRSVRRRHGS